MFYIFIINPSTWVLENLSDTFSVLIIISKFKLKTIKCGDPLLNHLLINQEKICPTINNENNRYLQAWKKCLNQFLVIHTYARVAMV